MSDAGKIIVITGANSGIGKETVRNLAAAGHTVVMACRHAARAEAARQEIAAGNDKVIVMRLDLASFTSIRTFADAFAKRFDHLDVLINNAGVIAFRKSLTEDGFEMQFGVNHLGHFLLTKLLMPQLEASGHARVINVSSMMHRMGKIDFDSFTGGKPYGLMKAYGQSKLANVLFTRELARRYKDVGISAFCLHPGAVATNIAGRGFIMRTLYGLLPGTLSPARGAQTTIYLATEAGIEHLSGNYFDEFSKMQPGSPLSQDMELASRLWSESERLTASGIQPPQTALK